MSDDEQVEELEHVEWLVDDDGTEYFVHEGRRFELGDDGYAYDVGPATDGGVADEESGSTPPAAGGDTDQLPAVDHAASPESSVAVDEASNGSPAGDSDAQPATVVSPPPGLERTPSGNGHAPQGESMLRIRGLRSGYGALPVLHGIDMDIARGSTAVLLGLNGAGKTTTASNICGVLGAWAGTIELEGTDITSWGVNRCVRGGVVLVPEGRRVFPELSVEKNLQIGAWQQRKDHEWVTEQRERVLGYFPRLRERLEQNAGTLSGGEQQMLAIARGLMARPKLLIIDEASMGLAPVIVSQVFEIIKQINDDGVTVLMIEQNVGALDVADVGIVMEQGTIIRELRGEELQDRALVSQTLMG
jgi:branched-chain amino acid transport system ATP-binding protein